MLTVLSQEPPPITIERVVVEGGGTSPWVTWVPIVVAVAALAFTAATFWWLNARKGHLRASVPRTCAMANPNERFLFRVPLTIYNTGARALVVGDLRCRFPNVSGIPDLPWRTLRKTIRPRPDDVEDFLRPFPVGGRDTETANVEFAYNGHVTQLGAGVYPVVIEVADGMKAPSDHNWETLVEFDLHVEDRDAPGAYITYPVSPRASN